MLKSGEALVLRRRKEGEKDAVVLLLFSSGERLWIRLFGILASIHRDRALAEPGSLIRITYYTKESEGESAGGAMKEGVVLERHEALKSDFRSMVLLSYLLELVAGASMGEADAAYFKLLQGALAELEGILANPGAFGPISPPDPEGAAETAKIHATGETEKTSQTPYGRVRVREFLNFFRIRVLKISGNLGDASHCSRCGSPLHERAFQERPEMSFLCARCDVRADSDDGWMARSVQAASRYRYASWIQGEGHDRSDRTGRRDESNLMQRLLERRLEEALRHYIAFSRVTVEELYRHYYGEEDES